MSGREREEGERSKRKNKKHTGTLDVADDGASRVVHELDADLSDATTGTCCARINFVFLMYDPTMQRDALPPPPGARGYACFEDGDDHGDDNGKSLLRLTSS